MMIAKFLGRVLRSLPVGFKGKWRLSRILLRMFAWNRRKEFSFSDGEGNMMLVPNILEPIGFGLFVDGIYEPETVDIIRELLPKDGTFVDVGANIGVISVPVAKHMQGGKVVSIEGSPTVFGFLQTNIKANHLEDRVTLKNVLLGRDNCVQEFFDAPIEKFGMGSVIGITGSTRIDLPCRTLDSLMQEICIDEIDVLKIDVEGAEAMVLTGAIRLLKEKRVKWIVFEFIDWAETNTLDLEPGDAQRIILENDYTLWRMERGKLSFLDGPMVTGSAMLLAGREKP